MSETSNNFLGIGSRVKHPAYGDGVIIRLHKAAYEPGHRGAAFLPFHRVFILE